MSNPTLTPAADGAERRIGRFHPRAERAELASRFKLASQKSKLAGTIRGSFFAFKNDY